MANATLILNTTTGETGATQTLSNDNLNLNKDAFYQVEIGAGDTVVIEGRIDSSLSFVTLATVTTNQLQAIKTPNSIRARRTVDGGSADSYVWIQQLDPSRGL